MIFAKTIVKKKRKEKRIRTSVKMYHRIVLRTSVNNPQVIALIMTLSLLPAKEKIKSPFLKNQTSILSSLALKTMVLKFNANKEGVEEEKECKEEREIRLRQKRSIIL